MMNVFFYVLVACFWGGSFIAIKPLVEIVPPLFAAWLRIFVAVIFLTGLLPLLKVSLWTSGQIKWRIWLIGQFAFTIPFGLLFWGERLISPGLAGILNGTVPLYVFVLGALFTPGIESITSKKIVGLVLGISGLVIIFYPQLSGGPTNSLWGTIAVSLMSVSYAVSGLMNRNVFKDYPQIHPFTNLYQQIVAAMFVLLPISLLLEGFPELNSTLLTSTSVASVLYLGIGSTSIAFVLFYKLIWAWGVVRASTVTYLIPVAALIFDFLINRTYPAQNEFFGVVAVTSGVVILNWPKQILKKD